MRAPSIAAILLVATAMLSGCGGGGSADTASPPGGAPSATPPAPAPAPAPPPTPGPAPSPAPAPVPPPVEPTPPVGQTTAADAARLLEQATFGPTDAAIAEVEASGASAWIDSQLALPSSGYPGIPWVEFNSANGCPVGSAETCTRDNYSAFPLQTRFFRNAVSGPDQLRQRVAFALSQIFVASANEVNHTYGMAAYQQMLADNAFGNYRTLLEQVTASPVMGLYVDMLNNDKPNPSKGTEPNENYAREVLQLFSIGLVDLNADGTPRLDGSGQPIPSYSQETIEGFAHAFTGWTWPTKAGATAKWLNPASYVGSMTAIPSHHDTGSKALLRGVVLPAGQSQDRDLSDALDNIANHPNVGPFIGKQLIQHLVTSNPTPAYVARISAVFADDGHGVRGNLGAVVKAILLDPEARGDTKADPSYGKLREPALILAAVVRGVGGQSDGVYLRDRSFAMNQPVFQAPSVFNFYQPDQSLPGSSLVSPSFGIFDTTSALIRIDFINTVLVTAIAPDPSVTGAIGTVVDRSSWQAIAADSEALMNRINRVFFHGAMTASSRNTILAAVNSIPVSDTNGRARAALYLALSSMQFQVEH